MSQNLVLGAISVATTSTVISEIRKDRKDQIPRTVLAGFVVAIALLFLSESQGNLSDSLAILIMVAAIIGPNGSEAINLFNKLVSS